MVSLSSKFWQGKSVILTGNTGFKGSWCALWLKTLGAHVHGISLPSAHSRVSLWGQLDQPVKHNNEGDIRDAAFVKSVFAEVQPEIVIHMAAQSLVRPSYLNPVDTFSTNVMGLVNVLEACRATSSVKSIVNVTSDKCYENREQVWPYRETDAMGGGDPYSASKGCAELVTSSYRKSFFSCEGAANLASARAGNVVGGGDYAKDRLVPDCIRAFLLRKPVRIRNPSAIRPWQHVLEPVSGYLMLAQALYEHPGSFEDGWNFGPPEEAAWPVSKVASRLAVEWGEGADWEPDSGIHPDEAILLRVDASKARYFLGWNSQLCMDKGLSWTISWAKQVRDGKSPLSVTLDQIAAFHALLLKSGVINDC